MLLLLALVVLLSATAAALELPVGWEKLIEHQTKIALSITLIVAFLGGIVSLMSPCGFAVLPVYFATVFKDPKRAFVSSGFFVLGITIAFAILGFIAASAGNLFDSYKLQLATFSGIVIIFFAILVFLNKGFSIFNFQVRHKPDHSYWGMLLTGFFFAIGWSPCVVPVLAGILFLAVNLGAALKGALLLAVYGLGAGIPLMVLSYFGDRFDWASKFRGKELQLSFFGRKVHTHIYNVIAGLILLFIGLLMVFEGGTFFFMREIPKYLPWTMTTMTIINDWLVKNAFLTSAAGQIIGILMILAVIAGIYYCIRRQLK